MSIVWSSSMKLRSDDYVPVRKISSVHSVDSEFIRERVKRSINAISKYPGIYFQFGKIELDLAITKARSIGAPFGQEISAYRFCLLSIKFALTIT